jgi:hypothetical protein
MSAFKAELGDALILQEEYDCGPIGNNDAPELDYMTQFDVVLIGSNYIPGPGVGDVLAEYCAAGGGVVELVAMNHATFGIGGDWRSDGYSVWPVNSALLGYSGGTILDPTHEIIDGVAGVASNWGCSLAIANTAITSGAVLLAESGSYKTAAYRNEDNIAPGSGRVAGINIFAQSGYFSGDALANATTTTNAHTAGDSVPHLQGRPPDLGDTGGRIRRQGGGQGRRPRENVWW